MGISVFVTKQHAIRHSDKEIRGANADAGDGRGSSGGGDSGGNRSSPLISCERIAVGPNSLEYCSQSSGLFVCPGGKTKELRLSKLPAALLIPFRALNCESGK